MNIDKNIPIYPIRTAAEILGVSVHTLRMYEREGLIVPFKKETNQRAYSQVDIDRINCIRKAISEDKISINGIKKLYSLIPCWEIKGCSDEDRNNCQAYKKFDGPCWSYKHNDNICAQNDCRECEVYKNFAQCNSIKESIKTILRK